MGGARAAISWPKAVAVTTRTVNPCGPAHLCRSLHSADALEASLIETCLLTTMLPLWSLSLMEPIIDIGQL